MYSEQEPWGEARADLRAAANTIWHRGGDDLPDLTWPYFKDAEAMWEKHKELEAKAQSPEHQEKLKQARIKHLEAMKQNGRQ